MSDAMLPPEARELVARIQAHLRAAVPLLLAAGTDADAFALRETERRYLPDTLRAYFDIPASMRLAAIDGHTSADAELLASLRTLEAATAAQLARLSEAVQAKLRVNPNSPRQGLGQAASAGTGDGTPSPTLDPLGALAPPTPTAMLREVFSRFDNAIRQDGEALLERVADQLGSAFPQLTNVRRSFFGRRIEGVQLEVIADSGALRYVLTRSGAELDASITQIVGGVPIKTESVSIDAWLAALAEHLNTYLERRRDAQEHLRAVFNRRR